MKIRLMGTKEEIAWFSKILENSAELEVLEISSLYKNRGESKLYRAYVEVAENNIIKGGPNGM